MAIFKQGEDWESIPQPVYDKLFVFMVRAQGYTRESLDDINADTLNYVAAVQTDQLMGEMSHKGIGTGAV